MHGLLRMTGGAAHTETIRSGRNFRMSEQRLLSETILADHRPLNHPGHRDGLERLAAGRDVPPAAIARSAATAWQAP